MYSQMMYMHRPMSRKTQSPAKSLVADARAAVAACAGCNSRLAARRITQFLDKRMKACGLGVAQFALMAQVAGARDDTLGGLAERTGLEQSTLSRNLRALEKQGLVEIATVDGDLRRRAVWLTEQGARRLESALPVWREAHEALALTLDPGLAARLAISARSL
jgi:DNA-binding MarR family transcriptional regulator